jgi:hypothetical protein
VSAHQVLQPTPRVTQNSIAQSALFIVNLKIAALTQHVRQMAHVLLLLSRALNLIHVTLQLAKMELVSLNQSLVTILMCVPMTHALPECASLPDKIAQLTNVTQLCVTQSEVVLLHQETFLFSVVTRILVLLTLVTLFEDVLIPKKFVQHWQIVLMSLVM